jgi:uncharacterized lipoprotein YmbA
MAELRVGAMRFRRSACAFLAGLAVTLAGCSSGSPSTTRLTLHVDGPVARASRGSCLFILPDGRNGIRIRGLVYRLAYTHWACSSSV